MLALTGTSLTVTLAGCPADSGDRDAETQPEHSPADTGTPTATQPTGATFAVTNLSPTDATVTASNRIDVDVTITNVGTAGGTQEIRLRIDETTVARESHTLASGEETTVSFIDIDTADLDPGNDYTYGVFSEDTSATGTLTVTFPNVILIMADDMGYGDTSVAPFTDDKFGGPIPTPNLAEMAANGATFRSHYNGPAPACTPTRAALLTGCYHPRVGMDGSVYFPNANAGLHPDETTIADLVRQREYATGCVGKWHLGDRDPFLPPTRDSRRIWVSPTATI